MFRWELGVVRVALEMVPILVDMLGSGIPQGIAEHTRDGIPERLSSCSGRGLPSKAQAAEQGAC